tara:strand:- start:101 stop:325 length:225 start_codon:yes stop_codon:yes gene_type:complete
MWIITRALNDYNQDGEYFVCGFTDKPTFQDIKEVLPKESDATIGKLTKGGGRQKVENEWYYLTELKSGEIHSHS